MVFLISLQLLLKKPFCADGRSLGPLSSHSQIPIGLKIFQIEFCLKLLLLYSFTSGEAQAKPMSLEPLLGYGGRAKLVYLCTEGLTGSVKTSNKTG